MGEQMSKLVDALSGDEELLSAVCHSMLEHGQKLTPEKMRQLDNPVKGSPVASMIQRVLQSHSYTWGESRADVIFMKKVSKGFREACQAVGIDLDTLGH